MLHIYSCLGKKCNLKFNVQKSYGDVTGKPYIGMRRHNMLIDNVPSP